MAYAPQTPTDTPDPLDGSLLDRGLEGLMIVVLAYLPFAFGGVHAFSHFVILVAACLMAGLLALRLAIEPERAFVWSWSYLPLALFVALVALQIVELPTSLVRLLSPETARITTELLSDPPPPAGTLERMTLSLYPYATRIDLRLLLAGVTLFIVVINVIRTRLQLTRLLVAIVVIGTAQALLALAQILSAADKIYWFIESPSRITSGSFVHYGHFSLFLNLAVAAAIALLLMRVRAQCLGQQLTLPLVAQQLRGTNQRPNALLAAFLVMAMVAIALSMSRNGVLSLLVAGAVTGIILDRTRFLAGIGWPLVGLVLVAFAALLVLGFDPFYERMATLGAPEEAYAGRAALLADTLRAGTHFPLAGMGLGTHELAFPMFDESLRPGTAAHAENLYAELFEETGALGIALLALFLAAGAWSYVRLVRHPTRLRHAAVFGLGFGVIAVLWHSWTDFGLHTPAVAALATVIFALIFAVRIHPQPAGATPRRRWGGALVCSLLAVLLAANLPAANRARLAEWHWRYVDVIGTILGKKTRYRWKGTREQYQTILEHAEQAVALAPDNAEYRYWLAAHRWNALVATSDRDAEPTPEEKRDAKPTPEEKEEKRATAQVAADELLRARLAGPTHGAIWSLYGQLLVEGLGDPGGATYIRRGYDLAPHHPMACAAAAKQALADGKEEDAMRALRRGISVGLDWRDAVDILLNKGRFDLAPELIGDDCDRLYGLYVLCRPQAAKVGEKVLAPLRARLITALRNACAAPSVRARYPAYLARVLEDAGDTEGAIQACRQHLDLNHSSGERKRLAKLLLRLDRKGDAKQELIIFLGMHPGDAEAKQLLESIR